MPNAVRFLARLLAYLFLLLPIIGILLMCLGLARGNMWNATLGGFLTSFGLTLWFLRSRRRRKKTKEAEAPMISMVLLLKEPRYLEARILAQIVSSAWGGEYEFRDTPEAPDPGTPNEGSSRLVAGASPLYAIFAPDGFYVLHNRAEPYFEDAEMAAAGAGEARTQKAIQEHLAWLSVDCVSGVSNKIERHEIYTRIARLIAELAGPDVLAILRPETGQINVWNEELEDTLRSPEAMEVLAKVHESRR